MAGRAARHLAADDPRGPRRTGCGRWRPRSRARAHSASACPSRAPRARTAGPPSSRSSRASSYRMAARSLPAASASRSSNARRAAAIAAARSSSVDEVAVATTSPVAGSRLSRLRRCSAPSRRPYSCRPRARPVLVSIMPPLQSSRPPRQLPRRAAPRRSSAVGSTRRRS